MSYSKTNHREINTDLRSEIKYYYHNEIRDFTNEKSSHLLMLNLHNFVHHNHPGSAKYHHTSSKI